MSAVAPHIFGLIQERAEESEGYAIAHALLCLAEETSLVHRALFSIASEISSVSTTLESQVGYKIEQVRTAIEGLDQSVIEVAKSIDEAR